MKHDSSWALRRVLKSLGRYLPLLIVSLVVAAASVAGTLYIPILVGDAIDAVVGPGQVDFAAVGMLAAKIAVLAAGTALLQWVMAAIHNRVCFAVTRDVRRQAFAHLQRLPLAYLDSHPAGDTLSRMIADVDQFADGLLMGFTQLFTGVLTIDQREDHAGGRRPDAAIPAGGEVHRGAHLLHVPDAVQGPRRADRAHQ